MSDIEDMYNHWLDQVTDPDDEDPVRRDLTVITRAPRFRWVTKLPACLRFNWLFKVDRVERYTAVYPSNMAKGPLDLEFTANASQREEDESNEQSTGTDLSPCQSDRQAPGSAD